MASGASRRFGGSRNKLLEEICGRAMFLRTADALFAAGLDPLIVARSEAVCAAAGGYNCLIHTAPEKSATIRHGLAHLIKAHDDAGISMAGCLFIPGDQPLVNTVSIRHMLAAFTADRRAVIRLGTGGRGRSPVIFPAAMFPELLNLTGEQGGSTLLAPAPLADGKRSCRTEGQEDAPPVFCSRIIVVEAEDASELMDVDTPEDLEKIREICSRLLVVQHPVVDK